MTFDDKLLEEKKEIFLKATIKASKYLNLPIPKVNFWEIDCPQSSGNELAHYHPDSNQICISKTNLIAMDFRTLEDTARHEVTHMIEENHDSNFMHQQNDIAVGSWGPPSGIVIEDPPKPSKEIKLKRNKPRKNECNYHLCNALANTSCTNCKKRFCKKHQESQQIGIPNFEGQSPKDIQEMENWRKEGHPCLEYKSENFDEYLPLDLHQELGKKFTVKDWEDQQPYIEPVTEEKLSGKPEKQEEIQKQDLPQTIAEPEIIIRTSIPLWKKTWFLLLVGILLIALTGFVLLQDTGKEERIFEEANQKCSVFVQSFCPTKKVEVEEENFSCLWNRKEQKCKVWWKK